MFDIKLYFSERYSVLIFNIVFYYAFSLFICECVRRQSSAGAAAALRFAVPSPKVRYRRKSA